MAWLSKIYNRFMENQAYKWGRDVAKLHLEIFLTFKEAMPEKEVEHLYLLTLMNIPQTQEFAGSFIKMAKDAAERDPEGYKFCLQEIVKRVVSSESMNTGAFSDGLETIEAFRGVEDTIPDSL